MGLDATVETATIEFARVTADSPNSEPVVVALVPVDPIRSGLLATRVVALELLAPFSNKHWSVGVEDAFVPFEISLYKPR